MFIFFFFSLRPLCLQESDGEKSDQDLVVDIANETVSSSLNEQNPAKKKDTQNTHTHTRKYLNYHS
jgi:hypothetical protein